MSKLTYKSAGVDLDVYAESMSRIPALLHRTYSPRTLKLDGGFAGLFQLDFPGKLFSRNYRDPVLVSSTDGVGTKLKVAQGCDRHDTVGIDLVAMSVNDALCCGAEPLFFLDYVAMSHDDPDRLEQIVQGISDGCVQADCSLLGGETAIMPDIYARGDYDLAGFCVGVVERDRIIDGKAIAEGDALIGVASSGFHSNGYSLLRKAVYEVGGLANDDFVEELGRTVGDVMLTPTRIYVAPVRKILRHYAVKQVVHGIAHVTGGGIAENFERLLQPGVRAVFQRGSWPIPPEFGWVQRLGEIDDEEMDRVFNLGIGLVLAVSPYYANTVQDLLRGCELASWKIGKIVAGESGCEWTEEALFPTS